MEAWDPRSNRKQIRLIRVPQRASGSSVLIWALCVPLRCSASLRFNDCYSHLTAETQRSAEARGETLQIDVMKQVTPLPRALHSRRA